MEWTEQGGRGLGGPINSKSVEEATHEIGSMVLAFAWLALEASEWRPTNPEGCRRFQLGGSEELDKRGDIWCLRSKNRRLRCSPKAAIYSLRPPIYVYIYIYTNNERNRPLFKLI